MKIAVLIPAAGASARFNPDGGNRSKLDEPLGERPVLHRTLDAFNNYSSPDAEIVHLAVAGPAREDAFEAFKLRHGDTLALLGIALIRGGQDHRYQTVRALLETVPPEATHIAVHDAARPCLSSVLLDRLFAAARQHPAVVPALPASETLKRAASDPIESAEPDPLAGILGTQSADDDVVWPVEQTVSRQHIWMAQTPQVFEADLLRRAYAQSDLSSTDDAQLVERLIELRGEQQQGRVVLVEGEAENIKITRPTDLVIARAILGLRDKSERPAHKRF